MARTIAITLLAAGLAAAVVPVLAQDPAGGGESVAPAAAPGRAENGHRKVVFLAGEPSHGYGAHEHFAGCQLLARRLMEAMPEFECEVFRHVWPDDEAALEDCDAIVMYCDGGQGHPVNRHLDLVDRLARKGTGIVCIHYGVEVPKGDSGNHFLDWIGGYFETDWSVNPHWTARFEALPDHPVTRGVRPFAIEDEWYYHMRFRDRMEGVTPILSALPDESTLTRPDGPHSGNPFVRQAVANHEPQHVAWVAERPGGGRGFGFTGGHDHWNWGNGDFRKVVLNAIVWTAHGEVPEHGVGGSLVTLEDLKQDQDYPAPDNYDWDRARSRISGSAEGVEPAGTASQGGSEG